MVEYIARMKVRMRDGVDRTFKVRGADAERVIYDVEVPGTVDGKLVIHNLENKMMSPRGFFRRTGWRAGK